MRFGFLSSKLTLVRQVPAIAHSDTKGQWSGPFPRRPGFTVPSTPSVGKHPPPHPSAAIQCKETNVSNPLVLFWGFFFFFCDQCFYVCKDLAFNGAGAKVQSFPFFLEFLKR